MPVWGAAMVEDCGIPMVDSEIMVEPPHLRPLIDRAGVGDQQAVHDLVTAYGCGFGLPSNDIDEAYFWADFLDDTPEADCLWAQLEYLGAIVAPTQEGRDERAGEMICRFAQAALANYHPAKVAIAAYGDTPIVSFVEQVLRDSGLEDALAFLHSDGLREQAREYRSTETFGFEGKS